MSLIPDGGQDPQANNEGGQDPQQGQDPQANNNDGGQDPQAGNEGGQDPQQGQDPNKPGYLFADGVVGEGDAPEWFKSEKYKTVSDQAKAYTELEGKFGAFKGAPKEGKYEIEGINFEENPLMATVAEWGIENQLSPDGLENLVAKVGELAQKQQDEDQAAALEALGENGNQRLADLSAWGRNNLSPDEYTQFQGLAQTAGHVQVLEKLIGMTKNSKLVKPDNVTTNSSTKADQEAEIKQKYLATNEKGQRLMEVDPAYRKKVQKEMSDFYNG